MITTISFTFDSADMTIAANEALRQITPGTLTRGEPKTWDALIEAVLQTTSANIEVTTTQGWLAGWNIPGYLPDDQPALFASWQQACAYLIDELERAQREQEDIGMDTVGATMVNAQRMAENYGAAIRELTSRSCMVSADPAHAEPLWTQVGNHVWWIAREVP